MTWFKLNSLEANPNKFQSMLISPNAPKDNDLQIEVNDNVITATSTMKILGMHIDSKLNFNGHIAFLCTKAGRQLNVLQRMRGSLDYVSKMAIYNSFIISNFNYCPVVWMFTSKSSLNKLENIQKRALRFVCNDFVSNYANPVYDVATICHQVRWLRWGHPSLFHTATSLLIWYKMFCVREISYRLIWMECINMFSVYAQSGNHSRFNW